MEKTPIITIFSSVINLTVIIASLLFVVLFIPAAVHDLTKHKFQRFKQVLIVGVVALVATILRVILGA